MLAAMAVASEVAFNLQCGVNPPTTEVARFDEIFKGTATSDVRFQINNKSIECQAVVDCFRGDLHGGTSAGMVGPGKSKVLGCAADATNPITRVILWCMGTSGNCIGTWEPVR